MGFLPYKHMLQCLSMVGLNGIMRQQEAKTALTPQISHCRNLVVGALAAWFLHKGWALVKETPLQLLQRLLQRPPEQNSTGSTIRPLPSIPRPTLSQDQLPQTQTSTRMLEASFTCNGQQTQLTLGIHFGWFSWVFSCNQ